VVIDLSRFASIMDIVRKDLVTTSRSEKVEYEDGTTNNEYKDVLLMVPCSFHDANTTIVHESDGKPIMNVTPMLIIGPEVNLKTGDKMIIFIRNAKGDILDIMNGIAGKVNRFQTHLEFDVDIEVKP
jgi:hypothetical protein